jgi:hypothetical protein
MRRLLRAGVACACTGCFQLSTAEVQVRDPKQVELQSPEGTDVLATGVDDGIVDRGTYWQMLSREPYEVRALRDDEGAIALRCEACGAAEFPHSGRGEVSLLDASGRSLAAPSWSVAVETERVAVDYDVCMIYGSRSCSVSARTRLVAPTSDVVEVRRRVEPVRIWGYMLLGVSAAMLAALSVYTLTPSNRPGDTMSDRWPWALVGAVPAFAIGGAGLWEAFAPAKEQVWRP